MPGRVFESGHLLNEVRIYLPRLSDSTPWIIGPLPQTTDESVMPPYRNPSTLPQTIASTRVTPFGARRDAVTATPSRPQRRRIPWALLAPAVIAMALGAVVMASRFDLQVADAIYAWEGQQWALRSALLTELVLHRFGHDSVVVAWLVVVLAWLCTWWRPQWRAGRRPLGALALSVAASTAAVALLKSWTNMDCPWDLARYGGDRAYVGLLTARPDAMAHAACFPSGHASSGYAWVALHFFFLAVRPAWRWPGLAFGLGLGFLFGVSQQLRGAHFLSHDLWTLGLCWLVAVGIHASLRLPLHRGDPC